MAKRTVVRSLLGLLLAVLLEAQQRRPFAIAEAAAYGARASTPERYRRRRHLRQQHRSHSRPLPKSSLGAAADSASPPPLEETPPPDSFDAFVTMRTGLAPDPSAPNSPGSSPTVFWAGRGEVYEAYSGKMLATFEGFDVGRGIRLENGHVRQLSRKIFWFRDAESGEVLREFGGQVVRPIKYDYQAFDYRRSDSSGGHDAGGGDAFATNGEAPPSLLGGSSNPYSLPPIIASVVSSRRVVPVMPVTVQTAGSPSRLTVQAGVFVDLEIPGVGPYQAWEFYDYVVDLAYPPDAPPVAVWCRQGSVPPFVDGGLGVMKTVCQRFDTFEELPESMKEFVEMEGYELFKDPPADMEEVERLQAEAEAARGRRR